MTTEQVHDLVDAGASPWVLLEFSADGGQGKGMAD